MFYVTRNIIQLTQSTFRRNIRLYCTAKQKRQSTSVDPSDKNNTNQKKQPSTDKQKDDDYDSEDDDQEQSNSHSDNQLMYGSNFEGIIRKDRETFMSMVQIFINRDVHRRNHCEFIYAALKQMKDFGVERDLSCYKALMDVMPKEKFIAQNVLQAEFMHYPKQQNCMMDLLGEMEWNGVMGDREVEQIIASIFGRSSHPYYKFQRHMYWIPKFVNLNPWLLPNPVPNDALELAKLGVRQMCTVDVESVVEVFDTESIEDSLDKTWIVSGQSPDQKMLLSKHSHSSPLKIEGPFTIWLRDRTLKYFTLVGDAEPNDKFAAKEDIDDVKGMKLPKFMTFLSSEPTEVVERKPDRSIHQQDDGTIYAICATGTSTKDSLLTWIRCLEVNDNPSLAHIPVLFQFRAPVENNTLVVVK